MSYRSQLFEGKMLLATLFTFAMQVPFTGFSEPQERTSPDPSSTQNSSPSRPIASIGTPSAIKTVSDYSSPAHRLSLGVELGGGINLSTAVLQGYFEGYLSLGIDAYNTCFTSKHRTCFRLYVLTPILGAGDYPQSQLPFFQAGVGLGFRIHFLQWLAWLFEGGVAVKFSPIPSSLDQGNAGILSFYRRDPHDSILPVGWLQTGISFALGQKLNSSASQGVHLQVVVRVADGPATVNALWKTLDLSLLIGVRWYFLK